MEPFDPFTERWPPAYDYDGLVATIESLLKDDRASSQFYESTREPDQVCQGDIVALTSDIPIIWKDGTPATQGEADHWLVLGNTCDLARSIEDVEWTQIVPMFPAPDEKDLIAKHRRYMIFRQFLVPAWSGGDGDHIADFLRPVSLHRAALADVAKLEARMSVYGWLLLHACLVRFLAREDGRFD